MIRLARVFEAFHNAFIEKYRDRLRSEHLGALAAIKHCRANVSPAFMLECATCEQRTLVPRSCGHRHCPHCQHHESQQWIERQRQNLLPVPYFLITFTLPAELRPLARAHPRSIYDMIMRCAWQTLSTFSRNDRELRGIPGAVAVLHTHSCRLDLHPHAHIVMPAGAIDEQRHRWRRKRSRNPTRPYLFNAKALAIVFRAKMLAALTAEGFTLPEHYPSAWVVHCKSVGSGEKALIYLGRYLYRGVIRENDIIECTDTHVRFRFRDSTTDTLEQRTVAGADFLWLVLQHVLPKGFRRARNFGFLHPNAKRLITALHIVLKVVLHPASALQRLRPACACPCCGAPMRIVHTRVRSATARASPVAVNPTGAHAM